MMTSKPTTILFVIAISAIFFSAFACTEGTETGGDAMNSSCKAVHLEVENMLDPMGIDRTNPAFSWMIVSTERNQAQTAYQILVASSEEILRQDQGDIADTGMVMSAQVTDVHIESMATLQSGTEYYWKVRIWDADGRVSDYSDAATFETAFLDPSEWKAKWITADIGVNNLRSAYPPMGENNVSPEPPMGENNVNPESQNTDYSLPYFGATFVTRNKKIDKARAYVSGLGIFDMSLNGKDVSENMYEPNEEMWFFLQMGADTEGAIDATYVTYDITGMLNQGSENAIGIILGAGKYKGFKVDDHYMGGGSNGHLMLICQIKITYSDGTTQTVTSNANEWKAATGAITYSEWYGGETYDANLEIDGWNRPGFNYEGWSDVKETTPQRKVVLVARNFNPLKVCETWKAVSVKKIDADTYLVDFGQNFSGVAEFALSAPAGTKIELYPGERLFSDTELISPSGEKTSCVDQTTMGGGTKTFGPFPSSAAYIYDTYVFKGKGTERWAPAFVYHGFRYLELKVISGSLGENITADMFTARRINAANEEIGSLETGNKVLNTINKMGYYSIVSNMYYYLTDCPDREKNNYMETPSLLFNAIADYFDVSSWMIKLADYEIPLVIGRYSEDSTNPDTGDPYWRGSIIPIVYQIYKTYGETAYLKEAYQYMVLYMEALMDNVNQETGLYGTGKFGDSLGDWEAYDNNTPVLLTINCRVYECARMMTEVAEALGYKEDAARFAGFADRSKDAFNAELFDYEAGTYKSVDGREPTPGNGPKDPANEGPYMTDNVSQATNGMPLSLGMVPEGYEQSVVSKLVESVVKADYALTTGEIAERYVLQALSEHGRGDLVYAMLTREKYPSFYYEYLHGVTALCETWSMEGGSHNHCMMAHYVGWGYEYLAGIRNGGIAFDKIIIDPYIPGDMKNLSASTGCVYGRISNSWEIDDSGIVTMVVEIPAGAAATVYLPTDNEKGVTESGKAVSGCTVENGKIVVKVGSGRYTYRFRLES